MSVCCMLEQGTFPADKCVGIIRKVEQRWEVDLPCLLEICSEMHCLHGIKLLVSCASPHQLNPF